MGSADYSQLVRDLGTQLQALGYDVWQQRLESASAAKGTSIDMILEVRKTLRELLAAKLALPAEVQNRAAQLFQELGRVLRS